MAESTSTSESSPGDAPLARSLLSLLHNVGVSNQSETATRAFNVAILGDMRFI